MTQRLYYNESYLSEFGAQVLQVSDDGLRAYLDQTAFYPTSGGQPFDIGELGGIRVVEVVDEEDRIAHVLAAPIATGAVSGRIDWKRRFDHMQQHTGQHLLSAVFIEMLGATTVSFHLGAESSTIELAIPALDAGQVASVEQRANEIVFEDRPVTIDFRHASEATDLRKASEREGLLRIVSIQDLDRSACGGTHVRRTGEIGPILIRKLDKIRGNVRVEFLAGGRAVRRVRNEYDALSQIGRAFSSSIEETPALVMALIERAAQSDKTLRRLSTELATARGRELYAETAADRNGVRKVVKQLDSISDDLRAEAQSFAAGPKAVLLVLGENPPTVLLAASKDSGMNAGQWLKPLLTELGGRGGGSPVMAQGSVPSKEALKTLAARF